MISFADINCDNIPIHVIKDVDKRISDWLASGGKETDPYITRQLEYLKKVSEQSNLTTKTD